MSSITSKVFISRVTLYRYRDTSGNPDLMPLPEYFKENGYRTFSVGKIYHNNEDSQDPQSWTEEPFEGFDYYKLALKR